MGAHSWGHSTVKVENEQYVIKELVLPSGQEIPWHRHATKHETHICTQGEGRVILCDERPDSTASYADYRTVYLAPGHHLDIPLGVWHKIIADPHVPLTILEPQGPNVEDIEWLS